MIKTPIKKINESRMNQEIENICNSMVSIYSNRSNDEYKMHGDITASSNYHTFEKLVDDLKTLKKFPSNEARDIKTMFMTLHRPVWKKYVMEYMRILKTDKKALKSEKNADIIAYTVAFTVGYRLLRGELARIYASTEATEKGIVYKPDKIARKERVLKFIKYYTNEIDTMISKAIQQATGKVRPLQEADNIIDSAVTVVEKVLGVFNNIFRHAMELNPISFMSAIMSRTYDNKVAKYDETVAMYIATKEAYDEYMKIPEKDRNKKVESKYVKNIEKYNIKMNNLKAKIDHYDSRAMEEAKDVAEGRSTSTEDTTPDTTDTNDSSDEDTSSNDDTSNDDDGGFDF